MKLKNPISILFVLLCLCGAVHAQRSVVSDIQLDSVRIGKTGKWMKFFVNDSYPQNDSLITIVNGQRSAKALPKFDSTSLSNRINNKLSGTDTLKLRQDINTKIGGTDTISLSNRINARLLPNDTLKLRQDINTKLSGTDTVSLSNRINAKSNGTDTTSLSNRINARLSGNDTLKLRQDINTKLSGIDTVSLSNRINAKSNGTDTTSLSNRINARLSGSDTLKLRQDVDSLKAQKGKLTSLDSAFEAGNVLTKSREINAGDNMFGVVTPNFLVKGKGAGASLMRRGVISDIDNLVNVQQTDVSNATADKLGISIVRTSVTFPTGGAAQLNTLLGYGKEVELNIRNGVYNGTTNFTADADRAAFVYSVDTLFRRQLVGRKDTFIVVGNEHNNGMYHLLDTSHIGTTLTETNSARRYWNNEVKVVDSVAKVVAPTQFKLGDAGFTGKPPKYLVWRNLMDSGRIADANEYAYTSFQANDRSKLPKFDTMAAYALQITFLKQLITLMNQDTMIARYANIHWKEPVNGIDSAHINPHGIIWTLDWMKRTLHRKVITNEMGTRSVEPTVFSEMLQAFSDGGAELNIGYDGSSYVSDPTPGGKDISLRDSTTQDLNMIGVGAKNRYAALSSTIKNYFRVVGNKTYLDNVGIGVKQILSIDVDNSIGVTSLSSSSNVDTANVEYFRGNIINIDTLSLKGGVYSYNGATTGVHPTGSAIGTIYFAANGTSRDWNGSASATMIAIDKTTGKMQSRGYTGTAWTAWQSPSGGSAVDTTIIENYYGNINNFDSASLKGGVYSYNAATTGIHPAASVIGTVYFSANGTSRDWNGTTSATMIAVDKTTGKMQSRGYTGTVWTAWQSTGGTTIDTTIIENFYGNITNFDTASLKGGVYSYTNTTTGTRASGMTIGSLFFSSSNASRDWNGATGATMFAVNTTGAIFARGFNGSNWSSWKSVSQIDTSSILYNNNSIGNFDTVNIKIGTYAYNNATTGTRPAGTTIGTVLLQKSGSGNVYDGTTAASMLMLDKNNKIYWRTYNGAVWAGWKVGVDSASALQDATIFLQNQFTVKQNANGWINKLRLDSLSVNSRIKINYPLTVAAATDTLLVKSASDSTIKGIDIASASPWTRAPISGFTSANIIQPRNFNDTMFFGAVNNTVYAKFNIYSTSNFFNPMSIGSGYTNSTYPLTVHAYANAVYLDGVMGANTNFLLAQPYFNSTAGLVQILFDGHTLQSTSGASTYSGSQIIYNARPQIAGAGIGDATLFNGYAESGNTNAGYANNLYIFHATASPSFKTASIYHGFKMDSISTLNPAVYGVEQYGTNATNIFDGVVFRTKFLPANTSASYDIVVKDKATGNLETVVSSSAASELSYLNQTYSGTATWTGTTAPSGTSTITYSIIKSAGGRKVDLWINAAYATAGAANTGVDFTWPSLAPLPLDVTGFTATNDAIYVDKGQISASTSAIGTNGTAAVVKTSTGYKLTVQGSSVSAKTAWLHISYVSSN